MALFKSGRHEDGTYSEVRPRRKKVIMGLDLGYTQVKVSAEELDSTRGIIFASLVELAPFVMNNHVESTADGHVIDLMSHGKTYLVGKKGDYNLAMQRFSGLNLEPDYAKYLTALGLYKQELEYQGIDREAIDLIVTGYPTDDLVPAEEERVKQALKGEFQFNLNGQLITKEVKNAWLLPQCMGAFFDYTLDFDGNLITEAAKQLSGRVLVINFGGKTTEVGIVEDGQYSANSSFTIPHGVTEVQDQLAVILKNEANKSNLQPLVLDKILRTRKYPYGRQEDLSEQIDMAVEFVFRGKIFPGLMKRESTSDLGNFNAVLVSGGGADLYYNIVDEYIANPHHLVLAKSEDPEMANAYGFRKFGVKVLAMKGKLYE